MFVPTRDIDRVADAHQRLVSAIERLVNEDLRRPSLLPGWSLGHVLAHLARNADSHVHRAVAAFRGEVIDQYQGGNVGRNAAIEEGASLPAGELLEDVRRSARSVEDAWRDLSRSAWLGRSRDANAKERFLFELPARRWQEVEVHLVDLDLGVSYRDWSDDFVLEWLPRTRERMWPQVPPAATGARFDKPADELAWFYGRLRREDLPELPPWG